LNAIDPAEEMPMAGMRIRGLKVLGMIFAAQRRAAMGWRYVKITIDQNRIY
jgi:hypothetical protein